MDVLRHKESTIKSTKQGVLSKAFSKKKVKAKKMALGDLDMGIATLEL